MTDAILVLNSGSSSIKFALYPVEAEASPTLAGGIDGIGRAARMKVRGVDGVPLADMPVEGGAGHDAALAFFWAWLGRNVADVRLLGAGHRVVHGGSGFVAPVRITPAILDQLAALSPLAPQHQPHNLAGIRAIARQHPDLPQIACFDTEFHATQPAIATEFPLPRALSAQGIRRYGFHGLSYEYIASILPAHLGTLAEGKVVVAHLGHGASMCAMKDRRSIATTMGFSALDGLMMGTRTGAIDPGVILHLLEQMGMTPGQVSRLLYEESGLLGVSGISDDMRDLLASRDPAAAEAIALFTYRIARELGSMAAALGGLDALVFTGGIGEHAAEVRAQVCAQASWLGVALDAQANAAGGPVIGRVGAYGAVLALATNEELVIARACRRLLAA